MDEADYLHLFTRRAEQTNDFLSNTRKWDRERQICQRFLETLNVPYRQEDFAAPGEQPPDVLFKGAGFEVFFAFDKGRRLNEEWREELTRCRRVVSLRQLIHREEWPQRIAVAELQAQPAPTLRKKAHNYSEHGTDHGELGLLTLINLRRTVSDFNTPFPPSTEYLRQGWCSLSMVGPTFARVLFTHSGAPESLRTNLGCSILFDAGVGL